MLVSMKPSFLSPIFGSLNMSDFPPSTEELIETFEDLQEWDERYDFMIDLGRELPALPAELQTEENIVEGCMSTVWVVTEMPGGVDQPMAIRADSDSIDLNFGDVFL